jgi:hypothetical protein
MDKYASLFTPLDKVIERNNYVVDDFALEIASRGDVPC